MATVSGGTNGVYTVSATPAFPLHKGQYGTPFHRDGMKVYVIDIRDGNASEGSPLSMRYAPYIIGANQLFVAQVYRDLLGRESDPSGLDMWSNLIDRNEASRPQFVFAMENSTEYRVHQVQVLSQDLLGQPASQTALINYVDFLSQGGMLEGVKAIMIGSDQYFVEHGNTFSGFLDALYKDVLDREPSSTDELFWSRLQPFSEFSVLRTAMAWLILNSPESDVLRINEDYQNYLRHQADPEVLHFLANALEQGVPEELVVALLVGSDAYFNQTLENHGG